MAVACNFSGFFCTSLRPGVLMRHLGLNNSNSSTCLARRCAASCWAFLSGCLAGRRSPREIVSLGYGLMAIAAVSNLLY